MLVLYEPEQIQSIAQPGIKTLLALRHRQLGGVRGFVVVEAGDGVAVLEQALSLPILTSLFGDCRFPDDDFAPAFEVLEDHGSCYEMVFLATDEGDATVLFIPKQAGIDADLLSLCQTYAVPATSSN